VPLFGAAVHQVTQMRNGMLILGGVVTAVLCAWYASPLGDWAAAAIVSRIPMQEDVALGRQAVAHERFQHADFDFGVAEIGRQLVASDPELVRTGIPFSFSVIKQDLVNAFAFPGGAIFVTEALIRQLSASRSELAAILGHEIGHVLHRHSQQRLVKSRLVPFLLDVLFYDDGDARQKPFGQATGEVLVSFAGQLGELAFSRANEFEADDMSWTLLVSAGYDPRALRSFFDKLLRLQNGSGAGGGALAGVVSAMLSTHPATKERIRVLERRWEALPKAEQARLAALSAGRAARHRPNRYSSGRYASGG
jgi:predicted Zn-dependent protease